MTRTLFDRLIWAPEAERDLIDIWRNAVLTVRPETADAYLRRLEKACQSLVAFPKLGRARGEIRSGLRSLSCPPHVIFYRAVEARIEVIRILHGRRDVPAIFDQR